MVRVYVPFFIAVGLFTGFYAWCCWSELPVIAHDVIDHWWLKLVSDVKAAGRSERFIFTAIVCVLLELFFWPFVLFFEVIHRNDWFAQYRLQPKETVRQSTFIFIIFVVFVLVVVYFLHASLRVI